MCKWSSVDYRYRYLSYYLILKPGEKVYSAVVKSEVMEGLACPRGNSSSSNTTSPQERKVAPSLPLVEGLAARFDSYFEKVSAGIWRRCKLHSR
jgi:hypothetical protein